MLIFALATITAVFSLAAGISSAMAIQAQKPTADHVERVWPTKLDLQRQKLERLYRASSSFDALN